MIIKECQLCRSSNLQLIIDLNYHPLADTFLATTQLNEPEIFYPLRVLICQDCGYTTLQYVVSAKTRYQEVDYSYTSSNSPVAIKHFAEMAKETINKLNLTSQDLVVDIGSNAGTLLESFHKLSGCEIIGVEPAPNIARLAEKNKIPTINDFFNKNSVQKILQKQPAKIITCTNTFNHITDLNEFMKNIKNLLDDNGFFIFEAPYLLHLVQKTAFDTIYLEHVSYFSFKPFSRFFEQFGLYISDIEENEYMGGSVRVSVGKNNENKALVKKYIKAEEEADIYDLHTYKVFMSQIEKLKFNLCRQLYEVKNQGEKIIGIGAATKGNTLLNYCQIDNSLIDFITDSSPLKIGKYTPGSRILIKNDVEITPDINYALILPWNIASFLKEKLKHLNLKFIIPQIK